MVLIEISQYRTLPTLRFTLTTGGLPFSLVNKTINFVLGRNETGQVTLRRACVVVGNPTEGRCDFKWQPGDTDYADVGLDAELELVLPDRRSQTISRMKVNITPSLGGG